jgi:hypothetical protein
MNILQRFADWRRERRIVRLREHCLCLYRAGQHDLALSAWEDLRDECLARSPQQVARMERARGLTHA